MLGESPLGMVTVDPSTRARARLRRRERPAGDQQAERERRQDEQQCEDARDHPTSACGELLAASITARTLIRARVTTRSPDGAWPSVNPRAGRPIAPRGCPTRRRSVVWAPGGGTGERVSESSGRGWLRSG